MHGKCFGCLLLVVIWGHIHGQGTAQSCVPPVLNNGFFVPEKKIYPHDTALTYACDTGYKPVVEGWWATSKCKNGKWDHEPQCIDESSCLSPTIPNGKYRGSQNGWYEDNHMLTVECDGGFELKHSHSTAYCRNGRWSALPECEKRWDACGVPPEIPHAVIIHQGPKEVFAAQSVLRYECEDGYVEGRPDSPKTITCWSRTWNGAPSCTVLAPPCVMDPHKYRRYGLELPSPIYLNEDERKFLVESYGCRFAAHCKERKIYLGQCCNYWDPYYRRCMWNPIE